MIRTIALITTVALAPLPALADGAADPVNRIMQIATERWATTEGGTTGYFDSIDRDFSKTFADTYRENKKYPAYEESDDPFDYDVITSSQDGCPLKDITISPPGDKNDVSVVDVSFKLWTCAPEAESQAKVNALKFDVVVEGGRPVISDVHRLTEGKWDSLLSEMKEAIARGKSAQQ
jgi:hypothetical protein